MVGHFWDVGSCGDSPRSIPQLIPFEDNGAKGIWFDAASRVEPQDPRIEAELRQLPRLEYLTGNETTSSYRNRPVVAEALVSVDGHYTVGSGHPDEDTPVTILEPGVPRRVLIAGRTDLGNHVLLAKAYEDERCNKSVVCPVPVPLDEILTFERL